MRAIREYEIIFVGGALTLTILILLAYLWNEMNHQDPSPEVPVQPVGGKIENPLNIGDNRPKSQNPEAQISISDDVEVSTFHDASSSDVPSIESFSSRGSGSRGGGGSNQDNGVQGVEAFLRVIPNPVPSPGLAVSVYGISRPTQAVSSTTFELYGADCPLEAGIPCDVKIDLSGSSPPTLVLTAEELALCDNNCEEYAITFEGNHFAKPGDYQVRANFQDSDGGVIVTREQKFVVLPFMVVAESPIGIVALVGSSLAGLGGFILLWRRRGEIHTRSIGDLGI